MTSIQYAINVYITENKTVSPVDMVNDLLPRFYPLNDTESKISFDLVLDAAKYFTTIIKRKDMCVEQTMLYKYNILSLQKNGCGEYIEKPSDVKRMLGQCKSLVNGVDFNVSKYAHINKTGSAPMQYTMTPKAFFMCLTRSNKTSIYAEYYFHVLEIYSYYEEYFTKMYKEKIENLEEINTSLDSEILEKEETIYTVESEKATLIVENMSLSQQMQQMMLQLQQFRNESTLMQQQTQTQLSTMQATLDKIHKKLPSCINEPSETDLNDQFIVMQKGDNNDYYTIRRQKKSMNRVINDKKKEGYQIIYGIYNNEFVPNAIHLWNSTKEVLVKDKLISFNDRSKNNITLNLSKEEFIAIIKDIFDSRKTY